MSPRRKRYRIGSKSKGKTTQSAVRFSKEAAAEEARRQLFHKSNPTIVRITVDNVKGDVV